MAKKKQFSVVRNFNVKLTLNRNVLEGFLVAIFDALVAIRSGDKKLGISLTQPMVAAIRTLNNQHDDYGYDLVDELKFTDEQLAKVAELIPAEVTNEFFDSVRSWEDGDSDDFYWDSAYPTQADRKAFIEALSAVVLERVQAVLKKREDDQAAYDAAEKKREEERKLREVNAQKSRISDMVAALRHAGYTVSEPPVPAKKVAPRKR